MESPLLVLNLEPSRFLFLAWFFEREGVRVLSADSVEDILLAAAHEPLRAIVVNSTASSRRLRDAIHRLHDALPDVSIACYDCIEAGADLVIERPLSTDDVIDAMNQHLAIRGRDW